MKKKSNLRFDFYEAENMENNLVDAGKWMFHFDEYTELSFDEIKSISEKAIRENVNEKIKHTNEFEFDARGTGILLFYVSKKDIETHRKVINFMIENNLIRKTKNGKFYNLSFKLDTDTRAKKYGKDLNTEIKLQDFIDLNSGEWIYNCDNEK